MNLDFKQIKGLSFLLGTLTTAISQRAVSKTLTVANIADEAVITHEMDSVNLVAKFLKNGREIRDIDIEPVNNNSIKIYLPQTGETNTFSGLIFLTKVK